MSRTLLSAAVGVPIALLAMTLWFLVERSNVNMRQRSHVTRVSAVLVTVVLFGLIVARFARYT
ncbi:MAG: hypothetical protein ABI862_21195 [Ilumatobacteraceae bacterium]